MKRNQNQFQAGFTVTELLVVFLIMILLSSLVIINWNKQTPTRNLTLGQNELITNIRKVQSYAVSSRNINTTLAAKYYVMRFERGASDYTISAVDSDGNYVPNLETVKLPQGIVTSTLTLVPTSGTTTTPNCTFIIFSVIYGKAYFGGDSTCSSNYVTTLINDPPALARRADYDLRLGISHSQTNGAKYVRIDSQTGRVENYTPSGKVNL